MTYTFRPQPSESAPAFEARRSYVMLGATRSLDTVGKKLGKSSALMSRWSARWSWVQHALDYDQHTAELELNAQAKERARIATRIERARLMLPDSELEAAARMSARAYDLLELPHVRRRTSEDGQPVIIAPAHASEFRAAKELLVAASELSRRALDLPATIAKLNLSGMSNAELTELLRFMAQEIEHDEHPAGTSSGGVAGGSTTPASTTTGDAPPTPPSTGTPTE